MRKNYAKGLLFILVLLIAVMPLAGCKSAGDKLNEEIAEGLTEKYLEGVTGGNADIEINEGEWPSEMPKVVPEFKGGKIDGSSSITVSGTTQISIAMVDVKEKEYTDYIADLVKAGFVEVMSSNYSGTLTASYMYGESNITLSLDTSSGDLLIGFTGNE